MNTSKKELGSLVNSLRDFLKAFDQASKCLQIPSPKPKTENGSTKSKDNRLTRYYEAIAEQSNANSINVPFWQ